MRLSRFVSLVLILSILSQPAFLQADDTESDFNTTKTHVNAIQISNPSLPNVPQQRGRMGEIMSRLFDTDGKIGNWYLKALGTREDGAVLRWTGGDGGRFMTGSIFDTGSNVSIQNQTTIGGNRYDAAGVLITRGTGKEQIILQTNDNNSDVGIAFRNSGGAYTHSIYRTNIGSNNADLRIAGGQATSTIGNLDDYVTIEGGASGGNVGIGLTDPGFKLDVSGDINFTGDLRKNGALYNPAGRFQDAATAGEIYYNGGFVGIGNNNPAQMLDVTGNANISGTLTVGSLSGDDITDNTIDSSEIQNDTITEADISNSFVARDANLLDGIDSGGFLQSGVADTMTEKLTIDSPTYNNHLSLIRSTETWDITPSTDGSLNFLHTSGGGQNRIEVPGLESTNNITVGGDTVWHAGNDGAGSGLSADNLDGINSASFVRSDADDVLDAQYIHDSSTNTNKFFFTRLGSTSNEYLSIGTTDGVTVFDRVNDEATSSIRFNLSATDTETGGGVNANNGYIDFITNTSGRSISIDGNNVLTSISVIDGDRITDGTIDSSEIGDNTLTAADLAPASVGTSELAADSVVSSKILNNTITASDIAADAINASELSDNSVASANIIDDTITEADISDSFVARNSQLLDGIDSTSFVRDTGNESIGGIKTFTTGLQSFENSNTAGTDIKFGRSVTQYITPHGGAAGNFLTSVSPSGNPKSFIIRSNRGTTNQDFIFDSSNGNLTVPGNAIADEPTAASHLTTKNYVDTLVTQGVTWKGPIEVGNTIVGTWGTCNASRQSWTTYNKNDDIIYICDGANWISIGSSASVPYASTTNAGKIQISGDLEGTWNNITLKNGVVDSNAIADNSITGTDIAANAIGISELADNSVQSANIIADSITAADIATNAVGNDELIDAPSFNYVNITPDHGRGLRFWNSDSYKIYMSSTGNGTWGGRLDSSSDYNMYFRMSSGTNRGFVFRNGTTNVAQIEGNGNIRTTGSIIANDATFGNELTLDSSNYGEHLRFSRSGQAWEVTPSTDGSLDFLHPTGAGFNRVDVPGLESTNNITVGGNTVWHAGNDGAGSGLSADNLDGIDSANFLRSDQNDTMNGELRLANTAHAPGANEYDMEISSPDTGDGNNELSLRFHQANRYYYQIRARAGGFRFTDGNDDDLTNISIRNPVNNEHAVTKSYADGLITNIPGDNIQDNTIDSSEIQNESIVAADIGPGSINSSELAGALTYTDNVGNANFRSLIIDHNATGSDALTTDRTHTALRLDLDSTASGGDTANEHRIYGIESDVDVSGDSDLVYGGYFSSNTTHSAGTISEVRGSYSYAASNSTAAVTNLRGAYNLAVDSANGSVANTVGSVSKALKDAGSTNTTATVIGLEAEAEIDAGTITNAYGIRSFIDRDGGTITNGYLFRGDYQGTLPSNAYGIYIDDPVDNYFHGNLGLGISDPQAKFHINGNIRMSGGSLAKEIAIDNTETSKTFKLEYGTDSTNQLRFSRYDNSFGSFEATPVRFDIDAPDNTLFVGQNGNTGFGTSATAERVTVDGRISITTDPNTGDDVGDRDYNDARYINVGEAISGDSITNDTIDSSEIENNTLTASDLAPNSVGNSELIDSPTVTTLNVSSNAPIINFFENDQTDPAGRWRVVADGGNLTFRKRSSAGTWSGETYPLGLTSVGGIYINGNLDVNDRDILDVRELELKDYDDNTGGTDNKYRLLARDGAFQFYNGGVVVGSYGNGTWTDLADGDLIVESQVAIGTTAVSDALTVQGTGRFQGTNPKLRFGESDTTNLNFQIRLQSGDLRFEKQNDAFSSSSEFMKIQDNGNVSIGGGDAANKFTVNAPGDVNGANSGGGILIQDSTAASSGYKLRLDANEMQASNNGSATTFSLNPFGGTVSIGANLNMTDGDMQNIREIELTDYDDNSGGTNNKYRLLGRDGAWQFFNGGVVVGNYGNGTWGDLADGELVVEGTATATAFVYSSDKRKKKNIKKYTNGIEVLNGISAVSYDWKDEEKGSDIGVIAQDVQKVFPEAVRVDSNGHLAVDYAKLVVPLIQVVQDQQKRIDELEARIK